MKLMLIAMDSTNPNRTEYIIKESINAEFVNVELSTIDLAEVLIHEGKIVANEHLFNEYQTVKPDVVLYSGVEALEDNIFNEFSNSLQIIWFYDAPFHVDVCKKGNLADYLFITAHGLVDEYKYWGVDCHWLLEGVYNPPHREGNILGGLEVDVAFVGSPDMHRNELLNKTQNTLEVNLGIWGSQCGPPYFGLDFYTWDDNLPYKDKVISGNEYPYICASAKVVLGINIYNNIYQYFSNRNLFTMACGGFLLTHYVPGLEELFVNHQHLVWYEDFDEACQLLQYYLDPAQDDERMKIKRSAYNYAHNNFSMTQQLKRMFKVCGVEYE